MFLDEKMNGWPGLPAKYAGRWDVAVQRFYLLEKKNKTKTKTTKKKEIGTVVDRDRTSIWENKTNDQHASYIIDRWATAGLD